MIAQPSLNLLNSPSLMCHAAATLHTFLSGQDQGQLHCRKDAGVLQEGYPQPHSATAGHRPEPALLGATGRPGVSMPCDHMAIQFKVCQAFVTDKATCTDQALLVLACVASAAAHTVGTCNSLLNKVLPPLCLAGLVLLPHPGSPGNLSPHPWLSLHPPDRTDRQYTQRPGQNRG